MRFLRDALITIVLLGVIALALVVAMVQRGGLAATEEPGRLERSVEGRPPASAVVNPNFLTRGMIGLQ